MPVGHTGGAHWWGTLVGHASACQYNMKITKSGIRRPIHIYKNDTYYFISSSTFNKLPVINTFEKKSYLKKFFFEKSQLFLVDMKAWVILDNHYHILFWLEEENNLSKFIGQVNGATARYFNKIDAGGARFSVPTGTINSAPPNSLRPLTTRNVWYRGKYWDRCIRSERDFWMRFNYIHNNPIKHGIIESIDKLDPYEFSSWNYYIKNCGEKWLLSVFEKYPVIDYTVEGIE